MPRLKGHKLTLRHNGERSREESGWTAECICGFEEYAHEKKEAQWEYTCHLATLKAKGE